MKNISNKLVLLLILVITLAMPLCVQSQPNSFDPVGNEPNDVYDTPAPISGLIGVAIFAGAMLGYKKLKK